MEICVICQDVITDETVCIPCGHKFCNSCIIEWNLQNNTCPNCRTRVISLLLSVSIYNWLRRTLSKYIINHCFHVAMQLNCNLTHLGDSLIRNDRVIPLRL